MSAQAALGYRMNIRYGGCLAMEKSEQQAEYDTISKSFVRDHH